MPTPIRKKSTIRKRAAEPSSWAGLAGILASFTPFLPPQYQVIAAAAGAISGAVAAFKADPGSAP